MANEELSNKMEEEIFTLESSIAFALGSIPNWRSLK